MAEGGFAVLEKVFSDKPVVTLSSLLEDQLLLPQPFRNAVAVEIWSSSNVQQQQTQTEQQLDWYQLTECCDSILLIRGMKDKWHLPCLASSTVCQCPFIPHASRQDWESLHARLGTVQMKWLLTQCSLFLLVGLRAWLQISGPLLHNGRLQKAFPFVTYSNGQAVMKRKRKENARQPTTTPTILSTTTSVQRPLKKIRLQSTDGPRTLLMLEPPVDNNKSTLIPQLKKVRIQQRRRSTTTDNNIPVIPVKKTGKTRRRRRRRSNNQIRDNRRAIDGSILIAHDEILYSSSGWTHFPISHPLFRTSSKEAMAAILTTPVGSQCDQQQQIDLSRLGQLIEIMGKNHRACHYTPIFRRISDPENATPSSRVYQFVKCVIKKVLPAELLGSQKNQQIFLLNVRRFIEAGRGTLFTLSELLESMKTSKCRWLCHLPVSLAVQISLLARLITWLFLDFVKPLIRQHFYATETTHGRNRIFFYSKDVWQRIHHRMMRSICSVSLRQPLPVLSVDPPDLLENLLLRARLRFVPKLKGLRPIMSTVFRRIGRKQVTSARLLLHTISGLYPEGMDAKSTHSLHRKWVQFILKRPIEPVYFVHADVEDAFGSIHHDKMVDILLWYKEQLPQRLNVRTLCHISPDGRRSKNFQIIPYFYRNNADEWVQRLAPGSVVFDLQSEMYDTTKLLEFAIQCVRQVQVIDNSKTHYRLARGIPQGSRLSSALCHIYYGHMVQEHLSEFLNNPDDLLIRVVDDFLYVTRSIQRAREFHCRIHQGFPDYNAYVNLAKSATNLDKPSVWSSFCGLQFNSRTLEIRGDYTRYERTDIIHCITPSSAGQPGKLLLKRLQGISTLKIETIYLDAAVNRKPTVVRSMFNACLMAAFRFHAIVKYILMRSQRHHGRFLAHTVIKECCAKMVGHVNRIRRKDVKISLSTSETAWLCYEAFYRKLSRHGKLYENLVLPTIRELQGPYTEKINTNNMRSWIGRRIPRPFRRMRDT